MDIEQAKEILQRYREGNSSLSENELMEKWYTQLVATGRLQWTEDEKELMQQIVEARILNEINGSEVNKSEIKLKRTVSLLPHFHWWAAASIIFLLGVAGYFIVYKKTKSQLAKIEFEDIKAPRATKATITLANGQKVYLDSAGSGALAVQGSIKLVMLPGGEIAYRQNREKGSGQIQYNTLSNPRGSRVINMVLADGSKVWLNAASSLTYPVSFHSHERKVSVTGEAYFEVFHDASKPFIVNNGSTNIKVLGTHFNVNAFEDNDNDIKVALLEGSVKINNGHASGLLKPGQEASVSNEIKIEDDIDMDKVMAWKNGYFGFDNASLQSVLKQISRWYDVDVIYAGSNQSRSFVGELQRDLNLSEILKILERNKVKFSLEGKRLIVMPD